MLFTNKKTPPTASFPDNPHYIFAIFITLRLYLICTHTHSSRDRVRLVMVRFESISQGRGSLCGTNRPWLWCRDMCVGVAAVGFVSVQCELLKVISRWRISQK